MKTLPILTAAAALSVFAHCAQADDDTRADDVRSMCPTIEDHLEDRLGALLVRHGEPGRAEVSFEIEGLTVGAVQTHGGPLAYRRATRRAIEELACSNADAGKRAVRLEVVFRKPRDR